MRQLGGILATAVTLAACASQQLRADDNNKQPVIQKVTFTFTSGNPNPIQMDIYGLNFGTVKPLVTLDGLTEIVTQYTNTHVAVNPLTPSAIAPGSYLLTVARVGGGDDDQRTAQFEVTVGAAGPQGPQGIQGSQGSQGLPGSQGQAGAAGVSGYQILVQNVTAQVNLSSTQTFTLTCPAGKVALAGSMNRLTAPVAGDDFSNRPATTPTTSSWAFDIFNRDLFAKTWQLTATCIAAN